MSYRPTKKDQVYDKFLSISSLVENAKDKIDRGYFQKAKDYLDHAKKAAEEGMEILRSILNEKDIWQE